jgi:tetratricopeptide (TPR) repeat protein
MCRLLGQQYFSNARFQPFLDKNFVLFQADNGESIGAEISRRFAVPGTPTTLVLGGDGAEVDWFVGYRPPAGNYQAQLERILKGRNTFKALQSAVAANPKSVSAIFGLARKWSERHDVAKAQEKYKEIIALDPDGKAGFYTDGNDFVTAPYAEYAKLDLAISISQGPKPDLAPVRAFIAENPQSLLVKKAFLFWASYYGDQPSGGDADKFFAEFEARFPSDPEVLVSCLTRIVYDKGPVDKAVELAGRLRALTAFSPDPEINLVIAQAYELSGDKAKAADAYGEIFVETRVRSLAYSLLTYAKYWVDRKDNLEHALAMAEAALKLQTNEGPSFLRSAAGVYLKAGDESKALDFYGPAWLENKAVAKNDQEMNSYASFWMRQGKNLESALAAVRKALEIRPESYYYWSSLSDVYARMNNKAEAVKAAEKALDLAPVTEKAAMQKKLDVLKGTAPEKK